MRIIKKSFPALLLLITLHSLQGCGAGITKGVLDKVFEDKPAQIEAQIQASANLNPDIDGKPSPLVVRMYELKNITEFNAGDFFAIYDDGKSLLALDLVKVEEMVVLPSENKVIEKELDIETRFIGVIGAYQNLEQSKWRAFIETPIDEKTKFTISLGEIGINIEKLKK